MSSIPRTHMVEEEDSQLVPSCPWTFICVHVHPTPTPYNNLKYCAVEVCSYGDKSTGFAMCLDLSGWELEECLSTGEALG